MWIIYYSNIICWIIVRKQTCMKPSVELKKKTCIYWKVVMHIQVQLRTESFELCVFDCYVVLLCSWDVPDRLINCALELKKVENHWSWRHKQRQRQTCKASQFTCLFLSFLFLVGGPLQISLCVPVTERPSFHVWTWTGRETRSWRWTDLLGENCFGRWDECDLYDIHIIKYASSQSQLAFYNRHDQRL